MPSSSISLHTPTREGYTFKGWYTNSSLTKKITKIAKGSHTNIKLYAKWKKNIASTQTILSVSDHITKAANYYKTALDYGAAARTDLYYSRAFDYLQAAMVEYYKAYSTSKKYYTFKNVNKDLEKIISILYSRIGEYDSYYDNKTLVRIYTLKGLTETYDLVVSVNDKMLTILKSLK